ncbi:MAG TPA: N-(5'-phosphoribosyl)anthranilate isomerase [Ruminiclostridium sp.]|jgi:phosphoribosylanthranilate isomerase|nr:phosphoribosylanthranilate isomerase [Clostridiaceae bacterium]HAA24588.1 N-(5'-phosphoribosyl)anthranilate isomerase [Ruminiclostridium sp.]
MNGNLLQNGSIQVPRVKICGITSEREIKFINELDINYVGFVFEKSRRQISVYDAARLRKALRGDIKAVGVFTSADSSIINKTAKICGIDIIQLHCSGDIEQGQYDLPVWKAVSIKDDKEELIKRLEGPYDAFVLDTYVKNKAGGTGVVFNWNLARDLSEKRKIVLAGGLTAENVAEAIYIVRPQIVDVSTGVEGICGKDEKKVKAFLHAAGYN